MLKYKFCYYEVLVLKEDKNVGKKRGGGIPTTMKNGKRTNFDQKALRLAFGSGELIRV